MIKKIRLNDLNEHIKCHPNYDPRIETIRLHNKYEQIPQSHYERGDSIDYEIISFIDEIITIDPLILKYIKFGHNHKGNLLIVLYDKIIFENEALYYKLKNYYPKFNDVNTIRLESELSQKDNWIKNMVFFNRTNNYFDQEMQLY